MEITRKTIRKWNDEARKHAKKSGYKGYEKKQTPSKIALNRMYIPKEEPSTWYEYGYYPLKRIATKEASELIRKKKCQYVKIISSRDEDGDKYGVLTYPKVKLY